MRTHENSRELFPLLTHHFLGRSPGQPGPGERSPRSTKVGMAQQRLAERVPPRVPLLGSRGVNSGHSCHLPAYTRRSALVLVRILIAARSSKLAMRVRFRSPAPRILAGRRSGQRQPDNGGDAQAAVRLTASWYDSTTGGDTLRWHRLRVRLSDPHQRARPDPPRRARGAGHRVPTADRRHDHPDRGGGAG
jgi:hypothetical protein